MKSFLILFGGHVGSSWLCSMLNSHDENFHVAFEPFMQIQHKRKNNKIDENLEKKIKNQFAKLIFANPSIDKISSNLNEYNQYVNFYKENSEFDRKISAKIDYKYVFCKARITEITPYIQNKLIPNKNVLLIYVYRQNKIKQAVSNIKRLRMNLGHFKNKEVSPPVSINPELILKVANKFSDKDSLSEAFFESVNTKKIKTSYEDLLTNLDIELEKIGGFLDIDLKSEKLKANYKKVTKDNLAEALENYEKVKAFFENSKYEECFEK